MTIRTEAELLEIFKDGQPANSITAEDVRDLVSSTRYLQPLGWEFRFDSQYGASGSPGGPLALDSAGPTAAKITFTDNPGEDLRYPSTFPNIWNNANQTLDITGFLNGFGIVRLSLFGMYTGGTIPHLEVQVDVGSDPIAPAGGGTASNIIYTDSQPFAKSAGDPQAFNWIIPLFGGNDFVDNGAHFIISSHNADADIWQYTMTAGAIMVPNPAGEG